MLLADLDEVDNWAPSPTDALRTLPRARGRRRAVPRALGEGGGSVAACT
jgi:hypothetical protein